MNEGAGKNRVDRVALIAAVATASEPRPESRRRPRSCANPPTRPGTPRKRSLRTVPRQAPLSMRGESCWNRGPVRLGAGVHP